ncbi:hypothetical protein HPB47_011396 [Ixodes persulcatus]|uniref:Uncharacterized protein n=1 Tax=Ixodes persulcatus TaxID=34615 RepID=A0AC60NX91_IXOPE|nr:hypothetical protein HPB47_011396 [Ixodes persulcatus]
MFPKCDDAKRYGYRHTKATAIVGEMAADAESSMLEFLKRCAFSITVDGSNDSGSQMYPIMATHYVKESRNVESRLLCLQELHGEATGRKIGNLVLDALKSRDIPMKNCIAFCADNANVMIGKKNSLAAVLKESQESLIVVGCPCHLINLAAEKGATCLPAKFDKVLVDIFLLPREERQAERQTSRIPRDAEHRGMQDFEARADAVAIAGKVPDQIAGAVAALGELLSKRDKAKSQQRPSFLGSYQIPKRATTLGEDKTVLHVPLEVPYQDLKNQKANEELVVGSRASSVVEGLPTSDKQQFFSAVRHYFAVACDYIRHKFPLEDETLKGAEVANLKFLSSASFKSLGFLIESFPQLLFQEKNTSREEALDALEVEFAELQAYDVSKDILNEERIVVQWSEAHLCDFSAGQWVTCFGAEAEQLLGNTAAELGGFFEGDESRLKTSVVSISPVNYVDYTKKLLKDIAEFEKVL